MTKYANVNAVKKQAREWDNEVLECRTNRHYWLSSDARHDKRGRFWTVIHVCGRCRKATRTQIWDERGVVIQSSIRYQDGYLSKGMGRVTGDALGALRLANITRGTVTEVDGDGSTSRRLKAV